MKTLTNHQIIYDNECPLCKAYTKTFVQTKMLDANGRKPFNEIVTENKFDIDLQKAQNQIALVNTTNGKVTYGLDSMLLVISNSFPIVGKIFKVKFFHYLFTKLYSLISYNRKVIAPSKVQSETSCTPAFNLKYRLVFMLLCIAFTTYILHAFASLLPLKKYGWYVETIVLILQAPLQYLFITNKNKTNFINYLGHLYFLSMLGSLLLVPVLIINALITLNPVISLAYFLIIVLVLFTLHFKRIQLLQLNTGLCFGWILIRVAYLAYILLLNF
jgi:predicted DCC family thiol-disulfide oxidoreductase YuxK